MTHRRNAARAALGCACLGLLLGGCAEPGGGGGLSAVLITLDTTRADALSCYGEESGATPALDQLAAEGTLYEAAYTVAPLTLPAHASMLTGLYPIRHTLRNNGLWPLPPSARTLAEMASEAGIQTAAFVASVVLDDSFGLGQGFEVYDEPRRPKDQVTSHYAQRPGREVVDGAIEWLRGRDRDRRFLLWVHLFEPHAPYAPPPEFRGGALAGRPYQGEVAAMDHEVGRLLDALRDEDLLPSTIVLAVGDHGEGLGEHGEPTHGTYCYESTLRVPMILRYPDGHRSGRRSEEVVSVVDVFPTLAVALGLRVSSDLDGESLYRSEVAEDRGIYFESYAGHLDNGWSPLAGWLDARGKYLHSSQPQFFEVRDDPGERLDLAAERADGMAAYFNAIAELASRPALAGERGPAPGEDLARQIRGLGYAGMGSPEAELPHPLAPTILPSPASMAGSASRSLRGLDLLNASRLAEAQAVFEGILKDNPRDYDALNRLANCFMRQNQPMKAIAPLRRFLRDRPLKAGPHFNLGVCLSVAGRNDEALAHMRRAIELDPGEAIFRRELAALLDRLGRRAEAAEVRRGGEGQ